VCCRRHKNGKIRNRPTTDPAPLFYARRLDCLSRLGRWLFTRLWRARLRLSGSEQSDIETEELAFRLVKALHQILVHPVFEIENPGAHWFQVELEERDIVERGARPEVERGSAKAVCDAGADQERIAEHKGLPAARELDRILAKRIGKEAAGMPADNGIFEGRMLRRVGSRRPRRLRREARKRIAVPAGQRADDADESVGVAEVEKRRFQLGERLGEPFKPTPRDASLGGRERPLERRIRIDVANSGVDVADREAAEPGFETDREPVAVLVVEHLVRLRRADPNSCHGKKSNTGSAMSYPRHLPPLPSMPAPRLRDDSSLCRTIACAAVGDGE